MATMVDRAANVAEFLFETRKQRYIAAQATGLDWEKVTFPAIADRFPGITEEELHRALLISLELDLVAKTELQRRIDRLRQQIGATE